MFNHKRLITLSIAASMVIPTFSTTTVLANESFVEVNDQEEMIFLETNNAKSPTKLKKTDFEETTINREIFRTETVTKEDGTASETRYFLKSGDYVLSEDVTVPFTIYTDPSANITIDLGQYTLTSTAFEGFQMVGGATLTIQGAKNQEKKGTIKLDKADSSYRGFVINSGTLKINTVEIVDGEHTEVINSGCGFQIIGSEENKGTITKVEIENSSIKGANTGIVISTLYADKNNLPTISLKNTSIESIDSGIQQNFNSNLNIENCMITGETYGISSMQGNLNILNSLVEATKYIGIQVVALNYFLNPSQVNIKNCQSYGKELGLLIDYDSVYSQSSGGFSIDVSNSTFKNSSNVGFGYRASEKKFQVNDPIFQKNITSLENIDPLPKAFDRDETTGEWKIIETNIIPYITQNSSTAPTEVSVELTGPASLETVPGTENVLTETGQTEVETKLKEIATEKDKNPTISVYSVQPNGGIKTEKPEAFSYINYDVKLTSPQFNKAQDRDTYTFQAIITAQLQSNSIIGLCLSLKKAQETTQSSQIEDEFKPMVLNEIEETPAQDYVLNVKLEDVLKTGNMDSGLSSNKIQSIFTALQDSSESHDSAQINSVDLKNFELDKEQLAKLEKIDLNQAFEIKDMGKVIEIDGTETEKVVRPTSTGSSKPKPKPEAPAEEQPTSPVTGTPTSMYRLYNRLTGEHLYTTNKAERDELLTSDTWKDEGQGWTAPSVSDFPVYRLLNPNTGDHHYTTDKNEFDTLPSFGWVAEGIAFFSADKDQEKNVILHRVYNPNAQGAGSHHYTTDQNERDSLIAQGWIDEGTAWAGLPTE